MTKESNGYGRGCHMIKADETHIQAAVSVLEWFRQAAHYDNEELTVYMNEFDVWELLSDREEMKRLSRAEIEEVIEKIGYRINLLNRTVMKKNAKVEQEELMKMYSSDSYKAGEETLMALAEQEQDEQRTRQVIKLLMEVNDIPLPEAFSKWYNSPVKLNKELTADECFEKL